MRARPEAVARPVEIIELADRQAFLDRHRHGRPPALGVERRQAILGVQRHIADADTRTAGPATKPRIAERRDHPDGHLVGQPVEHKGLRPERVHAGLAHIVGVGFDIGVADRHDRRRIGDHRPRPPRVAQALPRPFRRHGPAGRTGEPYCRHRNPMPAARASRLIRLAHPVSVPANAYPRRDAGIVPTI